LFSRYYYQTLHFGNNVSGMKKPAGRDFEDILQVPTIIVLYLSFGGHTKPVLRSKCIIPIPVFEGLLPVSSRHDNNIVMDLQLI